MHTMDEKGNAASEKSEDIVRQIVQTPFSVIEPRVAYAQAMSRVQSAISHISYDSNNPATRSRYASYPKLDREIRPHYTAEGFALTFDSEYISESFVKVLCYVMHSGGYERSYSLVLPCDGKGSKGGDVMTKTHAMGSAISYGRRYLLLMIFNLATGDEDDGNTAGGAEARVTEEQAASLATMADKVKVDMQKFLKYLKVDELAELPASRYNYALALLKKKGASA